MKNILRKTQQKICAIWRKTKQHISSFVGGQFKRRQRSNFVKLKINGQTTYCKKISNDKTVFNKFVESLTKTLKKMNILKKIKYYVEFQFCTRDCEIDYLFPNFFEVSDRKELVLLIKQTRKSIEEMFDVVSNTKPNPSIKYFNDTRYDDIYATHIKSGKLMYLELEEYKIKQTKEINEFSGLEYNFKENNPEFELGNFELGTVYQKLQTKKLPVKVLNNNTKFKDHPFHLIIQIVN